MKNSAIFSKKTGKNAKKAEKKRGELHARRSGGFLTAPPARFFPRASKAGFGNPPSKQPGDCCPMGAAARQMGSYRFLEAIFITRGLLYLCMITNSKSNIAPQMEVMRNTWKEPNHLAAITGIKLSGIFVSCTNSD